MRTTVRSPVLPLYFLIFTVRVAAITVSLSSTAFKPIVIRNTSNKPEQNIYILSGEASSPPARLVNRLGAESLQSAISMLATSLVNKQQKKKALTRSPGVEINVFLHTAASVWVPGPPTDALTSHKILLYTVFQSTASENYISTSGQCTAEWKQD